MSGPVCPSGKRAWEKRSDARRALRRWQSYGIGVKRLYRCPDCGAWHLTSASK